ncbi:hypothetical protein L596_001998 [Steinernema carpocapsae]|uniref:Uncharacterized protein n=1 Tax=Steinernema carpocapsae TaxID=34508 RepID=A0A4U8UN57_STECR|nr:hypothetical protein L596_001998 [Steinernema carpocapsae]
MNRLPQEDRQDQVAQIAERIQSYRPFKRVDIQFWNGKTEQFALRLLAVRSFEALTLRSDWPASFQQPIHEFLKRAKGKFFLCASTVPWSVAMVQLVVDKWIRGEILPTSLLGTRTFELADLADIQSDFLTTEDEACCWSYEKEETNFRLWFFAEGLQGRMESLNIYGEM